MLKMRGLALLVTLLLLVSLSLITAALSRQILDEQRLAGIAADNLQVFWRAERPLLLAEREAAQLDVQHDIACSVTKIVGFPVRRQRQQGCQLIELLDVSAALAAGQGRLYRISVVVPISQTKRSIVLQSHFIVTSCCIAESHHQSEASTNGKRIAWQHWTVAIGQRQLPDLPCSN